MNATGLRPLIWSGVYALLLLSVLTPFSVMTIFIIPIPGLVLFMLLDRVPFMIHYGLILMLVWLIAGPLGLPLVLISLFFIVPTIVMGRLYKQQKPAYFTIAAGILTFLGELVLILLLITSFGPNPVEWMRQFIQESIATVPEALWQGLTEEHINQAIAMTTRMIPLYLLFISFWYTAITHTLGVRLLKAVAGIEVPRMKPVREWMLPRSLVWYYLAALILDLFTAPDSDSLMVTVLWNLIPLLTFAFVVQAISFLFFITHAKGWNKMLPAAGIVSSFFLPGLVSLLGVFDIAFNIRKQVQKP